ncbi:hypothetical protein FSP39_023375 [Pinctada imbricata]|uniref:C2H2-type domain-containing protein n=1 Tax=Pinctada imbricata TaxID=66713 RepID=A0AA88YFG9_PINIB|nr:hypothetical protein FSP39_023375 [Pinctada imbricata]
MDVEPYSVLHRMCVSVGTNLELEASTGNYIVNGDWFHVQHLHVILTKFISDFLLHRQSSFEPSFHDVAFIPNHDSVQSTLYSKERIEDANRYEPESTDTSSRNIEVPESRSSDESCRTSTSLNSMHTIEKILSTTCTAVVNNSTPTNANAFCTDGYYSSLHMSEQIESSSRKDESVDSVTKQTKKTVSCLPSGLCEGNNVPYKCKDCEFVGKNKNALCFHRHKMHLSKPTTCVLCDKTFPNERYMKRHLQSHDREPSVCNICGKRYKNPRSLVVHKKSHTENYVKPEYTCDHCSKTFQTVQGLESHCNSEHLGQKKRFLCTSCGKSFSTKYTLQQHANTHTGSKPFKCNECSKCFAYESALREHKLIHSNLKKYQCQKCSKRFNRRNSLQVHEKIHNDQKEYQCEQCGRSFTQKQALERHERTHTGKKPYTCKVCGKKFRVASVIRRHLISVHKIEKDVDIWREDIQIESTDKEDPTSNSVVNTESETLSNLGCEASGDQYYSSMEHTPSSKNGNDKESSQGTSLMNDEQQNVSNMAISMHSHDQSTACDQDIHNNSQALLYHQHNVSYPYNSTMNVQGSFQPSIAQNESYPAFLPATSIGSVENSINCQQRICNEDGIDPARNEIDGTPFQAQELSIKSQANLTGELTISLENQKLHEQIPVSQHSIDSVLTENHNQVEQQFHEDSESCEKITETDQPRDLHYHEQTAGVSNFQTHDNMQIGTAESRCTRMEGEVSGNLSTDQINVSHTTEIENQRFSTEQHSSLPRVENLLTKRIQQDEPPDNLSISSLYAYYTNLASQFLSTHYPGYSQSHENQNQ